MNHGRLAGTGKFVVLPVYQGFEHGPVGSFAPSPPAYNPRYHVEFAIEAGCNAFEAMPHRTDLARRTNLREHPRATRLLPQGVPLPQGVVLELGARLDATPIGVAIEDTLKRTTAVEAKGLQVTTVDGKVTLRGTVHSLDARFAAESAA